MPRLVNPTREQLSAAIDAANATNNGYRTRLAYLPDALVDRILSEPDGIYQDDGGGVANSYNYTTRSTVVGTAWWTAPDGTKHVEIRGAQCSCSGRHVTPMWGALAQAGPYVLSVLQRREATVWSKVPGRRATLAADRAELEALGPQGEDDSQSIARPVIVARSEEGVLITDDPARPTVTQLVVVDPAHGTRAHLTVPPYYGDRQLTDRYGEEATIHAARAWTFGLAPQEFAPAIEA